jgi:hypothetical protein
MKVEREALPKAKGNLPKSFPKAQARKIKESAKRSGVTPLEALGAAFETQNSAQDMSWGRIIPSDRDVELLKIIETLTEQQNTRFRKYLRAAEEREAKKLDKPDSAASVPVTNRRHVIRYTQIVITALEEVLSYDSVRHHNQPPPDLWMDDAQYLSELRKLVEELKRLNNLLEKKTLRDKRTREAIQGVAAYSNLFLKSYASSVGKAAGKGSWYLLVGTIGALLYHAGVGDKLVTDVLSAVKMLR